ncbi:DUF1934 domain-containing protein [Paenibacillus caui]|uniref:DUF1934 domain-containing protein n=1 Tax=Paenibacillus caui TaxID=2873927 RepID=UPI001CA962F2|nr:DUF1934 domain-containing protein [Paenibacillus caui]
MPDSRAAAITLQSSDGTETSVQHMRGEVIHAGTGTYIRYEEPEQGPTGGTTRTTVIINKNELKILRHGEIQSQQTFRPGERLPGFYRSPLTTFQLSTDTKSLEIDTNVNGGSWSLKWAYDLYVYEELSGQFTISLQIQEEIRTC